jgi:3-isopropylmalate dehydrogenase
MPRSAKLAVIPGDGIGPEVITEAVKVLDAVTQSDDVVFDKTEFKLGATRFLETGDVLTDDDLPRGDQSACRSWPGGFRGRSRGH